MAAAAQHDDEFLLRPSRVRAVALGLLCGAMAIGLTTLARGAGETLSGSAIGLLWWAVTATFGVGAVFFGVQALVRRPIAAVRPEGLVVGPTGPRPDLIPWEEVHEAAVVRRDLTVPVLATTVRHRWLVLVPASAAGFLSRHPGLDWVGDLSAVGSDQAMGQSVGLSLQRVPDRTDVLVGRISAIAGAPVRDATPDDEWP